MKKSFIFIFLAFIVLIFLFLAKSITTARGADSAQGEYVPNEVLVKFKEDAVKDRIQAAIDSVQGIVVTYLKREISTLEWDSNTPSTRSFVSSPFLLHIRVPEEIGTEKAISILSTSAVVEYAEKNWIRHALTIPNDPYFSLLWGQHNTGQTGGTAGADIHAPEAWNIFTGSSNVVVAVLDTGIDYNHSDLSANIWVNPGESGGGKESNGIDDDHNGYIDDWHGWNFVNNNNDPMDDNLYLNNYHGTHVSGIIGAVGNNGIGVTGVNWNVKLMPLKVLNWHGDGQDADIIRAIDYATNNGAYVLNNSYGEYGYSQSLYDAISRAQTRGKLFVAAAGNESINNDATPHYPSNYNLANIIAVLATDHNDNMAPYSNYGSTTVHIGAPGGTDGSQSVYNIYSTMYGNAYQYHAGTSMATPYVTGVAALAWGKCPPLLFNQIKTRIMNKSDYLSSLNGKCVSSGRLNAYNVLYDPASPDGTPSNLQGSSSAWQIINLGWNDNSSNEIGFEIQRKKTGEADFSYIGSADANIGSYQDTSATGGIEILYKVRAYNMTGYSSFSNTLSITIPATVPAAPSNLHTVGVCRQYHVQLNWNDNANNELSYTIERSPAGGELWTQVGFASQNARSFLDTSVQIGAYNYRVVANNPIGSSYSNEIYVEVIGQ